MINCQTLKVSSDFKTDVKLYTNDTKFYMEFDGFSNDASTCPVNYQLYIVHESTGSGATLSGISQDDANSNKYQIKPSSNKTSGYFTF